MKTYRLLPMPPAPRTRALAAASFSTLFLFLPALAPSARAQLTLGSGAIVISSTDELAALAGMPISTHLIFNGTPTTDTGTLAIAPGSNIIFDSAGGSGNRLTLAAGKSGAFMLENNATLTFSNNNSGATNGAAILVDAGARLTLAAANGARYIFRDNVTTSSDAAIAVTGAAANLEVSNALFQSNTATAGGALFMNNGTAIINSSTFLNNTTLTNNSGIGGGAFYTAASAFHAEFNNVSFIGNHSADDSARGGAIGILNPAGDSILNINTTSGTSFFAGNTYGSGNTSSGIAVNHTALFTMDINISTQAGATLDMLDPFYIIHNINNAASSLNINKDGAGVWKLAGDNTLSKTGNNGVLSLTINSGTLYLYRAGEQIFVPGMGYVSAATGNVILMGATANAPVRFTLAAGASLSIGGGNKIVVSSPTQSAQQWITLSPGSILSYDLAGAFAAGLGGASTPLLTLSSPGLNSNFSIASSGTFDFSINFNTWISGSYNLLSVTKGGIPYLTTSGIPPPVPTTNSSASPTA